jgi:hypothetical protein
MSNLFQFFARRRHGIGWRFFIGRQSSGTFESAQRVGTKRPSEIILTEIQARDGKYFFVRDYSYKPFELIRQSYDNHHCIKRTVPISFRLSCD